jgi:hypothetical protein
MKINDIITLTQAGWTKDEIMSLVNGEAQDQTQQPDPQPEQQPAAQPEQPAQVRMDDRFAQMETKLDYVINRFNYMAVQNSQQPDQPGETVDDILASVVRGVKEK